LSVDEENFNGVGDTLHLYWRQSISTLASIQPMRDLHAGYELLVLQRQTRQPVQAT
jgi:hypothetical protein